MKNQEEARQKIKAKREPSQEEKESAISSQIYRELQAMEPENREEMTTLYLMNCMDRSQAEDLLLNEEENVEATMKFNQEKLQPGDEEKFRMSAWARLLAHRTPDKDLTYQAIQDGENLLEGGPEEE